MNVLVFVRGTGRPVDPGRGSIRPHRVALPLRPYTKAAAAVMEETTEAAVRTWFQTSHSRTYTGQ